MQGDGLAIIDAGLNFGGGILGRYGINSNTSGGGFLKCMAKKVKKTGDKGVAPASEDPPIVAPTKPGKQDKKKATVRAQPKKAAETPI
jgi:hypothetical protein